jgi:hypothetical protein
MAAGSLALFTFSASELEKVDAKDDDWVLVAADTLSANRSSDELSALGSDDAMNTAVSMRRFVAGGGEDDDAADATRRWRDDEWRRVLFPRRLPLVLWPRFRSVSVSVSVSVPLPLRPSACILRFLVLVLVLALALPLPLVVAAS